MAGPSRTHGDDERALIFINFDTTFGFEVMTGLDGSLAHGRQTQQDGVFKEDGRVKWPLILSRPGPPFNTLVFRIAHTISLRDFSFKL